MPVTTRLEELRAALRAENMSWGELHELQSLAAHIDPSDLELREAAGLPEDDDEYVAEMIRLNDQASADKDASAWFH